MLSTYNQASYTYNSSDPYNGNVAVTVAVGLIAIASSIPTATVTIPKTVSVNTLTLNALAKSVTVATTRNVTITAGILLSTLSLKSATVSIAKTATPSPLTISNILLSPTVLTQRQIKALASSLSINSSLISPAIVAERNFEPFPVIVMFAENIVPSGSIPNPLPSMQVPNETMLTLTGGTTSGQVADNRLTYNQAGYTYNDIRGIYGGFYGYTDNFSGKLNISNPVPTFLVT